MRFSRFYPIASIALAGLAAYLLYDLRAPQRPIFTSERLPKYTVSGRIVTSTGAPPREMTLWATRPTATGSAGSGLPVRADGSFTTVPLEPGTYVLSTGRDGDPTASATPVEGGFTVVTIGDTVVAGVMIHTKPTVNVRARIRYERRDYQVRTPDVVVHARLHVEAVPRGHGNVAFGQPDGSVMLYDVYGPRVIDLGWTSGGGWYPKAVLLNGIDITDRPTDFTTVSNAELEVVFAQRAPRR